MVVSQNVRLVALSALLALPAYFGPTLLHGAGLTSFTNGTVADAAAVNGNFTNLDGRLTTVETPVQGSVVKMAMTQTRAHSSYTVLPTGDGVALTSMSLTLTPKKAGNRVVLEWIIVGEGSENVTYLVTRNGVMLAEATNASNNRWAGITPQAYDTDNSSTMDNTVVKIIDMNSLDVASTYELRVRSSNGTTYTLMLNRSMGAVGQDSYENGLSVGTATEVWW